MSIVWITTTAAYTNGSRLYEEKALAADLSESLPSPGGKFAETLGGNFRFLNIKLALPRGDYEQFCEGLKSGSAELIIEGMKTEVERAK